MSAISIGWMALLAGGLMVDPAGGAMKLQMTQGLLVVESVYVNGQGPFRFVLDTGTTLNHLDPKLAAAIGLKPTFRTELLSSTGSTLVNGTAGVDIAIDAVHAGGQSFLLAGLDAIHQSLPQVQGVLGENFLSRFDYWLDLRGQQIEFGGRHADEHRHRTSFQTVAGRPVVPTSLGSLVLDSGASSVTLFGILAKGARELLTMTGSVKVGMVSRKLVIEGRTIWRGEAVAVPKSPETSAVGLLPVSLFKAVYFCNSDGYVVLE